MERIILMQGGVETLDYFSRQLGEAFVDLGYKVFYFDLQNTEESTRRVRKFIKTGKTLLLTFNFEGLEREDGLYKEGIGYVWKEYKLPCYNIAADHPYFYHERLMELVEDGMRDFYYHLSIDRKQEEYFLAAYPEFRSAGFLPLAGTNPFPEEEIPPISERSTDVVFVGNYTDIPFFEENINWINEEYEAFYRGILEDLIENPNQTIEEAAWRHSRRELGPLSAVELRQAMHKMLFLDLYMRNYYRGEIVSELLKNGASITVIGKGWEKLPVSSDAKLRILPQTNTLGCLQALRDAKISLNVMPWFKDGAHDRVYSSVLNGAVCLSDVSCYQQESLQEGLGVKYYFLKENLQVKSILEELLSDERKLQEMSDNGVAYAREHHTWKNRAKTLHFQVFDSTINGVF